MDHQGQFRRAALELGIPGDEISTFTSHLRVTIRLGGRGRSGGAPVGQYGGRPVGVDSSLPFIFSVDCAALPEVDGFALPADGTLLFFLDHEKDHLDDAAWEHRYARVVHVPAGTDLTFEGKEYDLTATLVADLPDWIDPDEDEDEDEDDLSPFQEQLARDLERDLPHLDDLRALADELWPRDSGLATAYLGGYLDDEVITSIAEQSLATREKAGEITVPVAKWYSHLEREKHRLSSEWVSLARFTLSDDFYRGTFVIRHDDLAAGRVDRALSVTEFSE
ncbi:hypothetical protein Ade02nite_35790 [Paractinoplanes deccanensis]|uniref:DUF1963 domain-containing protein n=1 Tax=Paractinoplanes deccanensis TaxID=113561 RepID=A0ABQ3Y4L7_9ACTN|nr:DUF1963 domain-containing protein [Actinoplanes deccanensis]GID74938.1 hypothetical protein Ade02nite_35790 [Actinoplanes deccanensis]